METREPKPYHVNIVGTDGYTSVIESASDIEGPLSITVTRIADQKSWRGTCDGVADAIALMHKIIRDQVLIAQMREGDRPKGEPA